MKYVRRVVTGNDANGRAVFSNDELLVNVKSVPSRPGYIVTNVWATAGAPVDVSSHDALGDITGVMPPPKGTVLRVVDFPPEPSDPEERKRVLAESFRHIYGDMAHDPLSGPHPGMHRTLTVDYAVVLEGEMTSILDADSTVLRTGDILIQRNTNHAWSNQSGKACRMLFVLLDGH